MAVTYDPTIGEQDYEGQGGFGPVGPLGPGGAPQPEPGTPFRETDEFGEPTGRWLMYDPSGRVVPYRAPSASTQGDTSAQVDGAGVPYVIRGGRGFKLDGTPYTPVPLPVRDPLAITAGQSAQIGLGYANLAQNAAELQQRIREAMARDAREEQILAFNRDKFRVETEEGHKDRALRTQQVIEAQQARMASNALDRQRLQQQYDLTTRQMQAEQASQQAQLAQRETESRRQVQESAANRTQRTAEANAADRLARDRAIAEYSASPTDVGKVSALLARHGGSNISTAIGQGETAVNLEPLAALLAPPAQAPQPQPTFLNAALQGAPDLNAGKTTQQIQQEALDAGWQAPVGYQGSGQGLTDAADLFLKQKQRGELPKMEHGGAVMDDDEMGEPDDTFMNGLMKLVHMRGMQPKAIAGEKGEANGETVYSNGDVVVMPDEGEGMDEMPKMQAGGASFLNPLMLMAQRFQQGVGKTALQRSGFDRAPTPVELSDPGTDPFRQQLGAATTAAVTGIPQQVFLNELMRIRPRGMQQGFASRTR